MATAAQAAPQQEESTQDTALTSSQPMDPSDVTAQARDPQKIAELAYSYWEARGGGNGSAEEDWLRAEQVIYGGPSTWEKRSFQ